MADEAKKVETSNTQTVSEKKSTPSTGGTQLLGINVVGKIVGLIVTIWLVSASYWAFGFFVLGMLPAILSMFLDKGAGRFASKTVTAFNFVGIVPFLFEIAQAFDRSVAAQRLMLDFWVWVVVYGTASLGWLTIWLFPQVTVIIFAMRAESKINKLQEEQKKLIEEWGEEVKEATKFKKKKPE